MKPEQQSISMLGITRSKAKMYEYSIPEEHHIAIFKDPARLLTLTIGLLGDYVSTSKKQDQSANTDDLKKVLLFSAQYFDSYKEAKLNDTIDSYLLLIGSATYYLCDLPGSSNVLVSKLKNPPDLGCDGLEELLFYLLTNNLKLDKSNSKNFGDNINVIISGLLDYYQTGSSSDVVLGNSYEICRQVYINGTSRQLLIADTINAVIKKRIECSSWNSLSKYTNIDINAWNDVIKKKKFIKEFWPSQILLGEQGVFNGRSTVIQMPTSAGKTKSVEIIVRSSFLSNRSKLAIIVAPFRALCTEIKNGLLTAFEGENISIDTPSDVFQVDFNILEDLNLEVSKSILILTPEKLMYMLRHNPELANAIGLVIYDEGHQFDTGLRGVTYELLISSLKRLIPGDIQKVLISAVISNAEIIGRWLNGDKGEVVHGANLSPTYRTIGFVSWKDYLGRIEFIDQYEPEKQEYFVPRVIEQLPLSLKGRETKKQSFPEKSDGKSIALYLGLKLVNNGSIAIFCGTKSTVSNLCEKIVDIYSRGYQAPSPDKYSDGEEVKKLTYLHSRHFGEESSITKSSQFGVYAHSGNTPQGVRLAIEHAMQKGKIKFVVCTSTLAQGVNLPIRYLIVTSVYQAGERIKTRDFHNLIGRAGRSGMYTEGSILFADSEVFDKKQTERESWKWRQVKNLLDNRNSEPCISTLLSIFEPLYSDNKEYSIKINPLDFVKLYLEDKGSVTTLPDRYAEKHADKTFTREGLNWQISRKIDIISAVESYLMAHWEDKEEEINEKDVIDLAMGTLAYFLSEKEEQEQIVELFKLLAKNVNSNFPQYSKRRAYGKTLMGVKDILEIERWCFENYGKLIMCEDSEELLITLWSILKQKIPNRTFAKLIPDDVSLKLALKWIQGGTYFEIFELGTSLGTKIKAGTQKRNLKQETIIEVCDNAFGFEATLVIAAIREVFQLEDLEQKEKIIELLNLLQKRMRYGLSDPLAIAYYEIGFSDRIIAGDLASNFQFHPSRSRLIPEIRAMADKVSSSLEKYPDYYTSVLREIVLPKSV